MWMKPEMSHKPHKSVNIKVEQGYEGYAGNSNKFTGILNMCAGNTLILAHSETTHFGADSMKGENVVQGLYNSKFQLSHV